MKPVKADFFALFSELNDFYFYSLQNAYDFCMYSNNNYKRRITDDCVGCPGAGQEGRGAAAGQTVPQAGGTARSGYRLCAQHDCDR